jgi:hypothetical protein
MDKYDAFVAAIRLDPNPQCTCAHELDQHAEATRPMLCANTVEELDDFGGFIDKLIWPCNAEGCGCEDFTRSVSVAS